MADTDLTARKRYIRTTSSQQHVSPIPQGLIAGGLVFLSALRGVEPGANKVPEDPETQIRQLFANLGNTLAAAGCGPADVVKVGVYMTDLQADRKIFNKVWAEYFGDEPPVRFAVQVSEMGGPGDATRVLADVVALAPRPVSGI
jgi:2-iminobutanoate/2-iminopropanoate deaminase